jgi:DNA-binding NtrC family response regulator
LQDGLQLTMTPALSNNGETYGMVGRDGRLRKIIETIRTAAPSDASVLIEGESGTGKHLIAAAIHAQSHRRSGPFIRLNCAAIPHELIEDVLFGGHDNRGLMETATGGTLLLEEIAELPSHLQTKLLRDLEIGVNFRLITITSRNTTSLLNEGILRKSLYFRISTIKIKVPALRERLDDVPSLAQHFLDHFNRQYDRQIRGVSPEAMFRMLKYDWPGNIRELESVIERAVLFCPANEVLPECLPEELRCGESHTVSFVIPPHVPIEEIERQAILQTLARTSGNVRRSAEILHYPRPTFYRKLKKFGIKVERDGSGAAGKLATST